MTFAGVIADRLFEGKVLFAAPKEEAADRCLFVRPAENRRLGDFHIAAQAQGIGWEPTGPFHNPFQLGFASAQCEIDRIAGMAIAGRGDKGQFAQSRMAVNENSPPDGQENVGETKVEDRGGDQWLGDK